MTPARGEPGAVEPDGMELDEETVQSCVRAVVTAANDLHLEPELFAEELAQGEIGLLITYLRAASPHVRDLGLRSRIDSLLHRLTAWTSRRDGDAASS